MVKEFPFNLKVYIKTRPNLRADEMTAFIGFGFLEKLFDSDKAIEDEYVTLSYPERWINILEQRILYKKIAARCPNMKEVTIVTHSVYIIQCTPNRCAFMTDKASDYPDSLDTDIRFCPTVDNVGPTFGIRGVHFLGNTN